jgi:SAM-dependent methyltransferase
MASCHRQNRRGSLSIGLRSVAQLEPHGAGRLGAGWGRYDARMATDPEPADLTAQAARNRAAWDALSDEYEAQHGAALAATGGLAWGTSRAPESELGVLGDVDGKDVMELGCGAAQWSIALARRGARPVGLDVSGRQLEHARRLMTEAGIEFPLVHASADAVPLPDASFDIVFCDHGAMTFADPYRTVPEVARLLRPGGLFAFNHTRRSRRSAGRSGPSTSASASSSTTSACTRSTTARM